MSDIVSENTQRTNMNWTIEEYKLLNDHYFHEDNLYQKVTTTFATLNAALLAFVSASTSGGNTVTQAAIPIVGMVLCICWFSSLVRIREYRLMSERRIRRIEEMLATMYWDNSEMIPDIRRMTHWDSENPNYTWRNWWYVWPYRSFRAIPINYDDASTHLVFYHMGSCA